jgi:hypothetical protein
MDETDAGVAAPYFVPAHPNCDHTRGLFFLFRFDSFFASISLFSRVTIGCLLAPPDFEVNSFE